MQQTYTQLPPAMPGVQGQFGQQLGLSASWLGSLPGQPSSGGPQSSMGVGMGPTLPGLETLSNMQQAMSSQVRDKGHPRAQEHAAGQLESAKGNASLLAL